MSLRRVRVCWRRACGRPRGAWSLAAPLLLQELAVVLSGAAMTLLAARLGSAAVAAIGWVEVLGQMLHALMGACAMGATVAAAQAVGAGRPGRLAALAADALALMLALGLILLALLWLAQDMLFALLLPGADPAVLAHARTYFQGLLWADVPAGLALVGAGLLRGMGRTGAAMRVQLAFTVTQLSTAALFMHGLDAGVPGAAAALVLSRGVALAVALHALAPLWPGRAWPTALARRWRRRGWAALTSRHARAVAAVGGPTALENIFFHLGKMLTQSLVAGLGTTAMAANFIAFALAGLMNIPGNALGAAGTTLVGQAVGAGELARARRQMLQLHRSAALVLCGLALPVALGAPALVALYTADPAVQAQAVALIRLNAAFMPVWAASFVLPAALRGAADSRYALGVATASMWGCRVLLGWGLGRALGWGVTGVWLGMFADWCVRGVLFWHRAKTLPLESESRENPSQLKR
ncbi:MATE family efflux transporter [Ideonella livida]|uniref:MATE family efflux transporter n=1 Tax=Ideonella livida TaxID=2707176 RepID=A0A7C9PFR4_9BURK|nr:MATE family efflux transporter [Ideonella livida]NDY90290.1 MATE family efflux transporter [Ideonella livida]